ncbi:MAG: hypothetical protein KKF44_10225 [Nanoarchaeota archaeon]|nr:hypothetical protein [Nanoarchaeota archaeon]
MDETIKYYNGLAERFSLPDFVSLNMDFDIEEYEKSDILLYRIRIRMIDKIDEWLKMLEGILQPDSELFQLIEYKIFSDKKRQEIYALYRKLMKYIRFSNEISLDNSEENNAKFIRDFFDEWTSLKPRLSQIIRDMKKSWEVETDIKQDLSYMG